MMTLLTVSKINRKLLALHVCIELRSLLFIFSQDFISMFTDMIKPLTKMLKKVQQGEWRSGQNLTYSTFKREWHRCPDWGCCSVMDTLFALCYPSRSSRVHVVSQNKGMSVSSLCMKRGMWCAWETCHGDPEITEWVKGIITKPNIFKSINRAVWAWQNNNYNRWSPEHTMRISSNLFTRKLTSKKLEQQERSPLW